MGISGWRVLIGLTSLAVLTAPFALAQEKAPAELPVPVPAPAPVPRRLTLEEVSALGEMVSELPTYWDNVYMRDRKAAELHRIGRSLIGAETEVLVVVRRVTRMEVLVEIEQVSRARFALLHSTPPEFGNLGTRRYTPPWDLPNFHRFTTPVGLRIGQEIPLEMAVRLRRSDVLRLRGQVVAVPVVTDRSAFNPWLSLIVGNWKVVEVVEPDERGSY